MKTRKQTGRHTPFSSNGGKKSKLDFGQKPKKKDANPYSKRLNSLMKGTKKK